MMPLLGVVETKPYLSVAESLMSEAERAAVVEAIATKPEAGVLIRGGGGLRKVRIPLRGRGKRGGARVIYWYHSEDYPAVLLFVFAKNEATDLSREQLKRLARLTDGLLEDFRGGK